MKMNTYTGVNSQNLNPMVHKHSFTKTKFIGCLYNYDVVNRTYAIEFIIAADDPSYPSEKLFQWFKVNTFNK